jgi:hypothetical protein
MPFAAIALEVSLLCFVGAGLAIMLSSFHAPLRGVAGQLIAVGLVLVGSATLIPHG